MFIQMPEYVNKFEKFTNLVTERFDVSVVLDGAKAETNGKQISLPNIYGMTEVEVEFLYGILLHEVGHIRHSCFDKELFSKFKSQAHFLLYNAIEDARIENALMKEYGGAADIFNDLYSRSNDPQFMQKVFGGDGSSPSDPFFIFGLMLHEYFLTINAPLPKIKKAILTKSQEMFESVRHIVEVAVLKDGWDVQKVATEIYDIIYAQNTDKSEKIDIKADEEEKEKTQEGIDQMLQELMDVKKMADDMRKQLQPQRDQKKALRKEYKKEERKMNKLQKEIDKKVEPLENELIQNEPLNNAEAAMRRLEQQLHNKKSEQGKLSRKISTQKEGLEQSQRDKADPDKDNKKATQKEKYHTKRKAKLEADKTPIDQKVQELKQRLEQAKQDFNREMQKPGPSGQTPEQLNQEINDLESQTDPSTQKMNDLNNQIKPLSEQISDGNQQVADARQAALKKNIQNIMKAAQAANDAGLPSPIPPFTPNDDWAEADGVQKQFDNKAAEKTELPVVNGMSPFGSNLRDVIMRLTDVSNNLKQLDVTQVITRKLNKSKFENLDNETDMTNSEDALDVKSNDTLIRPHVPVTRNFDRVQEKTAGGDLVGINQIKIEKKSDITKVAQVLQRKFKFKTKKRFRPNQEEGQLDTRELWRIPNGLGTKIFETTIKRNESKVQVSIAIDVSGSMDKDCTENGLKIKQLAVTLSEALNNASVKHEILGYGASPSYEVEGYKGSAVFNRKRHALETIVYKKADGRSGLQNLELEPWDNADGESLRLVADRLLRSGAKKKIMFVISDGKPYLTDEDTNVLDYDLHKAIEDCKKKGISIYGFGFNDTPRNFYDKYCKVENIDNLVAFLNKNIETVS